MLAILYNKYRKKKKAPDAYRFYLPFGKRNFGLGRKPWAGQMPFSLND